MDEKIKEVEQTNEETPKQPEESLSIVEEARKIRDDIKSENDRREKILEEDRKLRAESILGGTTGGAIPPVEPQEVTPKDYVDKLQKGEVNPLKEDGFI